MASNKSLDLRVQEIQQNSPAQKNCRYSKALAKPQQFSVSKMRSHFGMKKNLLTLALAGGILLSSAYKADSYFVMYNEIKNVMIVPGHDGRRSSGGTRGRAGKESEIALRISSRLEKKLKENNFRVFVTRDSDCYGRPLVNTIRHSFDKLKDYVYENPKAHHFNDNIIDYPMILFGIAQHANENNFDLILNVHMDKADVRGAKGFTIIYSEKNKRADESREITRYIRDSMIEGGFKPSSVYGKGFDGIVERDDILLLGNHRIPINAASVLIECDYIDNLDFLKSKTLDKAVECFYEGIEKYNQKCK